MRWTRCAEPWKLLPTTGLTKTEKRLATLRTSLDAVEASILWFENTIKECCMREEEAVSAQAEAASQPQLDSRDEANDVEMAKPEMGHHLASFGSQVEATTEDQPPSASGGDTVSTEEVTILLGGTAQAADGSPARETASVSGGMAGLQLATPPHPETEEETSM